MAKTKKTVNNKESKNLTKKEATKKVANKITRKKVVKTKVNQSNIEIEDKLDNDIPVLEDPKHLKVMFNKRRTTAWYTLQGLGQKE